MKPIIDTAIRALGSGFGDLLSTEAAATARPKIAASLYEAIRFSTSILYDWKHNNSGENGQLIPLAAEVLGRGVGTCLDVALLYAAAQEHGHLPPAVVILDTGNGWHALSGFFCVDAVRATVLQDPADIQRLADPKN